MGIRAVIIATGDRTIEAIKLRQVMPLMPCVDRPVVQHIIEVLVECGITEFDIVLHEAPQEIEAFLGDGKRWGASFNFQLARAGERPYRILKLLNSSDPVVLADAGYLPILTAEQLTPGADTRGVMYCASSSDADAAGRWTGWAYLGPQMVAAMPENPTRAEMESFLHSAREDGVIEYATETLELGTLDGLLEAQRRILTNAIAGVHLSARRVEPGVWIARNVVIHPTAALTAPLFIGENSRIGAGSRIGPNASIGYDTVVDRHTIIKDSAILSGSYCGEGLELDHVFVDRNRLINVDLNTEVHISDSFILGSMKGSKRRGRLAGFCSRGVAAMLLVVSLPVLCLVALIRRKQFTRRQVVRLPALDVPESWVEFSLYSFRRPEENMDDGRIRRILFDIVPNLLQIVKGRLRFVGVQARSPEEIEQLSEDWRALYLQAHAGLITEAGVLHGSAATDDEVYSSEVYYSAMRSPGHDFGLAFHFLARTTHNV
jgi:hypothetical protein